MQSLICQTAACSFPGENARSWEALGEARPGQSSLSTGARRYRAWAQKLLLILCDPMDCSPLGSSVHGIFQARVLEWGAIAFSQ